jgi:hypothetical protein
MTSLCTLTGIQQSWRALANKIISIPPGRCFHSLFDANACVEDNNNSESTIACVGHAERDNLCNHLRHEMRGIKAHSNIKWNLEDPLDKYC